MTDSLISLTGFVGDMTSFSVGISQQLMHKTVSGPCWQVPATAGGDANFTDGCRKLNYLETVFQAIMSIDQ